MDMLYRLLRRAKKCKVSMRNGSDKPPWVTPNSHNEYQNPKSHTKRANLSTTVSVGLHCNLRSAFQEVHILICLQLQELIGH